MSSVLDLHRPIILEQKSEACKVALFRFRTLGQLTKFVLIILCTFCSGCEAVISKMDLAQSNPIRHPMAKILKGKNAQHGGAEGHPYLVSIQYLDAVHNGELFYSPFCGGAILDRNTIVTAGHCFDTKPDCWVTDPTICYRIVAGIHDVDLSHQQQSILFPISSITIHNNYNRSHFDNDIAMIHLGHSLYFDEFVQHIPLVTPNTTYSRTGVIAGFGSIGPTLYPSILQETNVTIYSDAVCENQWGIAYHKKEMICAGNTESSNNADNDLVADACFGDSGGPLVVTDVDDPTRKYLMGIISWGYTPCGSKAYPGLYTRLETYLDWIMETRRKIPLRQLAHILHNHHHHPHQ